MGGLLKSSTDLHRAVVQLRHARVMPAAVSTTTSAAATPAPATQDDYRAYRESCYSSDARTRSPASFGNGGLGGGGADFELGAELRASCTTRRMDYRRSCWKSRAATETSSLRSRLEHACARSRSAAPAARSRPSVLENIAASRTARSRAYLAGRTASQYRPPISSCPSTLPTRARQHRSRDRSPRSARGPKRELVTLAEHNARHLLAELRVTADEAEERAADPVYELQRQLGLERVPRALVCFDISHAQGTDTVASCVWFQNGRPHRGEYRKLKVKTVEGVDDFASMREVVGRYFRRRIDEKQSLPDLVVIDGGRGHRAPHTVPLVGWSASRPADHALAKRDEKEVSVPAAATR